MFEKKPTGSKEKAPKLVELEAKLAGQEQKAAAYYDQLLRLKAEFENFRKRVDRERPEWVKLGRRELLGRMLPVYDVLLAAHRQMDKTHAGGELAKGMEMIFKEFEKIFQAEKVAPIESVGRPYDHGQHEVLGVVETADQDEDVVVEELQRGFTVEGEVLRPARVRIAKRPKDELKPEGPQAPATEEGEKNK